MNKADRAERCEIYPTLGRGLSLQGLRLMPFVVSVCPALLLLFLARDWFTSEAVAFPYWWSLAGVASIAAPFGALLHRKTEQAVFITCSALLLLGAIIGDDRGSVCAGGLLAFSSALVVGALPASWAQSVAVRMLLVLATVSAAFLLQVGERALILPALVSACLVLAAGSRPGVSSNVAWSVPVIAVLSMPTAMVRVLVSSRGGALGTGLIDGGTGSFSAFALELGQCSLWVFAIGLVACWVCLFQNAPREQKVDKTTPYMPLWPAQVASLLALQLHCSGDRAPVSGGGWEISLVWAVVLLSTARTSINILRCPRPRWAVVRACLVAFSMGIGVAFVFFFWCFSNADAKVDRLVSSTSYPNIGHPQSAEIPKVLADVVIASEDHNYLSHRGIDLEALHWAIRRNVATGTWSRGGSTITQQAARYAIAGKAKTLGRKVEEAFLALALERRLSKGQILVLFFDSADYGMGCTGLPRAAQVYFGKTPGRLDLAESIAIACFIWHPPSKPSEIGLALSHRETVARRLIAMGGYDDLLVRQAAGLEPQALFRSSESGELRHVAQMKRHLGGGFWNQD